MRRASCILTYCIIIVLTILISCGKNQNEKESDTETDSITVKDNVSTTISTDIDKLGKILDFETYKPTKVKFKYTLIDNSGQNKRLSTPGPSDYSLEALLYFDAETFEKFYEFDRYADYPSPEYNREEFKFEWLDKEILLELENSNKDYEGHPDFFFTEVNGKSWYLDGKILLKTSSN
ncbi:hypothetical protein [Flavobacterium sp.]|uniref:hypothetical protein n=1 Tax=Flavobacterium sp. TaxID=239 RepID=UPI00261869F7|nr:hypothetical protein [Flavobacterium sp.]